MKKTYHLIGEISNHEAELLVEHILAYEEIDEAIYNEKFRDLEIWSDYKNILTIVEDCIEEEKLNIKLVERKKQKNSTYEKRYFTFTNFVHEENKVFIESYLRNDPSVESISFDKTQNIMTITTNDPFIYNKISYVVEGLDEEIEVGEYFVSDKVLNQDFLVNLFLLVLFVVGFGLVVVTQREPSILTEVGWLIVFSMLIYPIAVKTIENFNNKKFFDYSQISLLGALGMFVLGHHFHACLLIIACTWIQSLFTHVRLHFIERAIHKMDSMVGTVLVDSEDGLIEKQVEEIEIGDVIFYQAGNRIHVDGSVLEGEAMVDSCLMSGNEKVELVTMHQLVHSGDFVSKGGLKVKVDEIYHQSALYRLYHFNPKELLQHGYLEEKSKRLDLYYSFINFIIGLVLIIAGITFVKQGKVHYMMSGFVFMVLGYPNVLMRLRPLFYQLLKVVAISKNVIFKTEDALNRFMEVANDQYEIKNDDIIQYHKGGLNVQSIMSEANLIYTDEEGLEYLAHASKTIVSLWTRSRYVVYVLKFLLSLFYFLAVFNFESVIIFNLLLNIGIIYFSAKTMNKLF